MPEVKGAVGMDSRDSDEASGQPEGNAPLVALTLRDGRSASIAPDALRIGDESFALDRLQDARQIVPEPPTIAVRIAARGLVEFTPVSTEQACLALEAIYRLRPDLRPVGFEAPAEVPAWWPPAHQVAPAWEGTSHASRQGAAPGAENSGGYPPFYMPRAPGAPPGGYASPDGRVTPYPRDVARLIGATFRLYLTHWRELILLGLCAAGLPSVLSGALQMALYAVQGHNPWRAIDTTVVGIIPSHLPKAGVLLAMLTLGLLLVLVMILSSAWQVAVLSDAARRALLGERVDIRASLTAGTRRFVPVLLVTLAFAGAALVAVGAPVGLLLLVTAQVGPNPNAATASLSVVLSACLGLVWLVAGFALVMYGAGRLVLAPYLAATQPLGPRAAILASWQLTRGYWWHTVLPILGVVLVVSLLSAPVGNVELISYGLEVLLAQPLANAVLSPLLAIAAMAVLEDIRVRTQGYDAVIH